MTLATIKQDILKQYQYLISKALSKALDIIFSPCCDVAITSVVYDCATEDLTLTLSPEQATIAANGGTVKVFTDGGTPGDVIYLGQNSLESGTTAVIGVPLADAPIGVGQIFTAEIFLPTNVAGTSGVTIIAVSAATTIVPC